MDLFNLAAKLSLDGKNFTDGLKNADKQGRNFAQKLTKSFNLVSKAAKTVLGGVVVKTVVSSMRSLINASAQFGDTIDKQSQVLGMSRKAYQEWDYILGQNGASIDSMAMSMKTMNALIASGSAEASEALQALGVDIDLLNSLDVEHQFDYLVNQFQKLPQGAAKSSLAIKLFGRNGQELLPLLNQTGESTQALRDDMQKLGLYISDDAVDAYVTYGDAVDTMKRTLNALKTTIIADILPPITAGVMKLTTYAGKLSEAYKEGGISKVFETLVEDIKAIKWPSWNDISAAITSAWNTIVSGVAGLTKIAYSALVDIGIPLPDWDSVAGAITTGWNTVTSAFNKLLKLLFGEKVDGSINWPSWSGIKQTIEQGWSIVKSAFDGLAKLVFGTNIDGTINYPNWDDIAQTIKGGWKIVTNAFESLAKLVFGENVDGTIKWPSWTGIKQTIEHGWGIVVNAFNGLAKLVFGTNVDGTIKWPNWTSLKQTLEQGWGIVVKAFNGLAKLVFGANVDGTIKWPDWRGIAQTITNGWNTVKEAFNDLLKLMFGTKVDGSIDFPKWSDIATSITEGWQTVVGAFGELATLVFGSKVDGDVELPNLKKIKVQIDVLWFQIKSYAAGLGGLIFGKDERGKVNWPSLTDLFKTADDLWHNLVEYVGKLTGLVFGANTETTAAIFNQIATAIEAIGAAFVTYQLVTNVEKFTKALSSLFTGGGLTGWKKWELILAGISAVAVVLYENWDKISEVIATVGGYIDEYIIQPITEVFSDVKTWISDNIVDPIKSAFEWIKQVFQDVKDFLGIGKDVEPGSIPVKDFTKAEMRDFGKYDAMGYAMMRGTSLEQAENELAHMWLTLTAMSTEDYANEFDLDTDTALAELNDMAKKLAALTGTDYVARVKVETVYDDDGTTPYSHGVHGGYASHAKGLWTVPYDNYRANLHRGERVLSASQARQAGGGGGGMTAESITAAISAAMNDLIGSMKIELNNKAVGKVVGNSVTSRVHRNIDFANNRTSFSHGATVKR